MASSSLVVHMAQLARALRARGLVIGIGDEIDAVQALELVDLSDPDEVKLAIRTALKIRRRDWELFDLVFRAAWSQRARDPLSAPARERPPAGGLRASGERPSPEAGSCTSLSPEDDERPGYSRDALLRRKPFDQWSASDVSALERVLNRLAPRLATRRSRRLVPTHGRGVADLRRSFRRAVATGGELVSLARRQRAVEEPQLLVLCDTSGSMRPHARFLLSFVVALKRVVRRTEIFVFNTSLTRLTPWLMRARVGSSLQRLVESVPDWAGGTRIGESLIDFIQRYGDELLTPRTVVVIFSDGLDRGDPELAGRAMRLIHARARRVLWLNPLAGDPRYEPTARAMQAALPYIDQLAPAHDLASLERIIPEVSRVTSPRAR